MGPRWLKMAPTEVKIGEDEVKMCKMIPRRSQSKSIEKPKENLGFCRVRGSREGPRWAQDRPKMAQDGPKLAQDGPKLAQDRAKMGQDGRKMAQDTENELQGAAQDRQDAISEGCPERLIKKYPVEGR